MKREDILRQALEAREDEVLHYQINIDNYERAIVKSESDPDLIDFTQKLQELLSSSKLEQKKAMIMRDVVREQLEG